MNVSLQYQITGSTGKEIAANVEQAVRTGRIRAGARLPAVRGLANRLQVSPATVASAYRTLRLRGIVHGSGRRGTLVNRRPPLVTPSFPPIPPGVRNLVAGNPDPRLLPQLKEVLTRIECSSPLYGGAANRKDLLKLASNRFKADGIGADSLTIVNGAMDAIERILMTYLRAGDAVGVEDPCYIGTLDLIAALGLVPEPIAIDDFGPTPSAMATAVRAGVQAILITPRGQNPTGAALDRKRAGALRAVLAQYPDVLAIEDDFTCGIAGVPACSIASGRERWGIIRSVSKSLGPDLRLAIVAGDPLTIDRVEGRQRLGARWTSHILQEAVVAMWSDPRVTRIVRRAEETYAVRRQALINSLRKHQIEARGRSGLNVWIPVTEESSAAQSLLDAGWAVLAGEAFRIKSPPGLRVMTACLELDEAPRLARDIAAALRPRASAHVV